MIDQIAAAEQLTQNGARIQALAAGVHDLGARWRPDPESWSVLEVMNHLLDEEREDFRLRLDLILHHPGEPWPPIHPGEWVTSRYYNTRDLGETAAALAAERAASVAWLRGLEAPNWEAAQEMPWGTIRAGDLLAAWVAHDLLHMRQLVELFYAYAIAQQAPYAAQYAGEW